MPAWSCPYHRATKFIWVWTCREACICVAAARLPQPRSVPQLVRSLNKVRRNDTLYVKLLDAEAGAVVNGELLSSLPPSVLGVLEGDRNSGNFNPLHSATIAEWAEQVTSNLLDWRR